MFPGRGVISPGRLNQLVHMPLDPERHWTPPPTSSFEFPADREVDLLKDFCRARYRRSLSGPELEWLAGFVADYFAWSRDHAHRNELRTAALRCLRLLVVIDELMGG